MEGQIKLGFEKLDIKIREIEDYEKWSLIAVARYLVSDLTNKIKELFKHQNDDAEIQRSLQGSMFNLHNRLKKTDRSI